MNSEPPAPPGCVWALATPSGRSGAIAAIDVAGPDLDGTLRRLGLPAPPPGEARYARLLGVDEGLVIRWSPGLATLTPHAGPAVLRALTARLRDAGVPRAESLAPQARHPEAEDEIEAMALEAVGRAASPLAVDLLLDQPRRWREVRAGSENLSESLADGRVLGRLLRPPLVAAVGASNIGKSTLLNALAGRSVALVADEPGTTRDRVGALLELDGLSVRWLDTPGIREEAGAIERAAIDAALAAVGREADLVLLCGDPRTPPPAVPLAAGQETVRVCLRSDLGACRWGAEVEVSAVGDGGGAGIEALARAVRRRLVPDGALSDPRPWRFWTQGGQGGGGA